MSKHSATFSILIIAIINLSRSYSTIINFDRSAAEYDEGSILKKSHKLSCNDYEAVSLNGLSLSEIPAGFIRSSNIKSILLSHNNISEIPKDVFDEVPNLECLDLSYNRLSITELLNFRHDRLKILIFDHQTLNEWENTVTSIMEYHPSSANFPNVEVLSLKNTDYEESSLYNKLFPKLSTIFWEQSQLRYVNSDMTNYIGPHLRVVHLEHNYLEKFIVRDLKNVEELYLDDNPLEDISIDISSNLKVLSLANCNIDGRWNVWFPTVITLDLSMNRLTAIDTELVAGSILENLSLDHNRFTILPALAKFPQLRKLSLNYNFIQNIRFAGPLNSLKSLNLRGNRISHIDPSMFLNAPALEQLDLAENKLSSLPYDLGQSLKMLRSINLRSNKFMSMAHIDNFSFTNLNQIYVGNNQFNTITQNDIKYMPSNCTVYVS